MHAPTRSNMRESSRTARQRRKPGAVVRPAQQLDREPGAPGKALGEPVRVRRVRRVAGNEQRETTRQSRIQIRSE